MRTLMISVKFCSSSFQLRKLFILSFSSSLSSITIETQGCWKLLIRSFTLMIQNQRRNTILEVGIRYFLHVCFTIIQFTTLSTLSWLNSELLWKKPYQTRQSMQLNWWKKHKKFFNRIHFMETSTNWVPWKQRLRERSS